ncbi:hypothetical protein HYW54_02405 [Candidatus Gottesmanbacteria bacterium]|nr:hypothetical protein [Candidatus Gottesmanbacteria bacterium]
MSISAPIRMEGIRPPPVRRLGESTIVKSAREVTAGIQTKEGVAFEKSVKKGKRKEALDKTDKLLTKGIDDVDKDLDLTGRGDALDKKAEELEALVREKEADNSDVKAAQKEYDGLKATYDRDYEFGVDLGKAAHLPRDQKGVELKGTVLGGLKAHYENEMMKLCDNRGVLKSGNEARAREIAGKLYDVDRELRHMNEMIQTSGGVRERAKRGAQGVVRRFGRSADEQVENVLDFSRGLRAEEGIVKGVVEVAGRLRHRALDSQGIQWQGDIARVMEVASHAKVEVAGRTPTSEVASNAAKAFVNGRMREVRVQLLNGNSANGTESTANAAAGTNGANGAEDVNNTNPEEAKKREEYIRTEGVRGLGELTGLGVDLSGSAEDVANGLESKTEGGWEKAKHAENVHYIQAAQEVQRRLANFPDKVQAGIVQKQLDAAKAEPDPTKKAEMLQSIAMLLGFMMLSSGESQGV